MKSMEMALRKGSLFLKFIKENGLDKSQVIQIKGLRGLEEDLLTLKRDTGLVLTFTAEPTGTAHGATSAGEATATDTGHGVTT